MLELLDVSLEFNLRGIKDLLVCLRDRLVVEQCLEFGFGEHRIEGIGDKHIPWIHNVKNTDFAIGLDDEATMNLIRLFNEPAGIAYLVDQIRQAGADTSPGTSPLNVQR